MDISKSSKVDSMVKYEHSDRGDVNDNNANTNNYLKLGGKVLFKRIGYCLSLPYTYAS